MQTTRDINLSVIIPAYNAANWLPRSVPKVADAISQANITKAEIIIVDDGSTDNTLSIAKTFKLQYDVKVISQKNSGRFLARSTGVDNAQYGYILFIDTRVYIGKNSLKYIVEKLLNDSDDRFVWTSHVIIEKEGNIYARFWEAITYISWRKYFSNPRDCSYGIKDFDYYPKGTTCFFAPKNTVLDANRWFSGSTKNTKASNDDTLLIRRIAEKHPINISPNFYCTYYARTNLKQFTKHVFHRGKVFVDGFLRRDGNRFFWPLITFLLLSLLVPILLFFFPEFIILFMLILTIMWAIQFPSALVLGAPFKDAVSLFILSPLFALIYGLGIWSAVITIYVRKGAL